MDAPVQRNNTEGEELFQFQEQVEKTGMLSWHVMNLARQHYVDQQATAKRQVVQKTSEGDPPVKKFRYKFRVNLQSEVTKAGQTVRTVRDVVKLLPPNKGGYKVVINPNTQAFGISAKETQPKVDTAAKPRYNYRGHSLIINEDFNLSSSDPRNNLQRMVERDEQ